MRSALPKMVHKVVGRPMVDWAVRTATSVSTMLPVVVVGYGREQVESCLVNRAEFVEQKELLGTGHAAMQAV